jgi:hypothetical protein
MPKKDGGLGIRNLWAVNHSLILSAAWRIAEKPTSQLHLILKSKYFLETSLWRPNHTAPKSAFWASVLKVLPILQRNAFYQLAEGSTSI